MDDLRYLRAAIRLSEQHMLAGHGGPFGAVIVQNGKIVGRGWNRVTSQNDPTAHAEITAIRAACRKLKTFCLSGCTLYSSCEPCPMCAAAIHWARLDRVVYAATRRDAARAGFDDALLFREVGRPPARRRLPHVQALPKPARAVLAAWSAKPDRTPY